MARQAIAAEGKRAQIQFHETQKEAFTSVYLDAVEVLPDEAAIEGDDERANEVAWRTAIDAASYRAATRSNVSSPRGILPQAETAEGPRCR